MQKCQYKICSFFNFHYCAQKPTVGFVYIARRNREFCRQL